MTEILEGSCCILGDTKGKNKLNNHLLMTGFHTEIGNPMFLHYGASETMVW